MEEEVKIRRANRADIDFIIETIIEAEKSLTDKISYCNIFSLSESELLDILRNILSEDITGQDLCYSEYLIAEVNGVVAGAMRRLG